MKKIITVLVVLAVMTAGVFATTGDTIVLTTGVAARTNGGFTTADVTSFSQNVTAVNNGQEVATTAIGSYRVYYQSNEKKTITLSLSASPFKSATVGTQIGYKLKVGGNEFTTTKNASDTTVTVATITNTSATGASYAFSDYAVTSDDETLAAAATDYKSTLTLTITAN